MKTLTIATLLVFAIASPAVMAVESSLPVEPGPPAELNIRSTPTPVDAILAKLNARTSTLKSYQCRIEYLFSQPLFDSKSLRTGMLYYQKADNKSDLRVDFNTLQQDDENIQKYKQQYILDGLWLSIVDYQLEQVKAHEMAKPSKTNKPTDAFELINKNFPIIGFSKVDELKKQFDISMVPLPREQAEKFIKLKLKVKPNSIYKNEYTTIDFWIDKKLYLPAKIVSTSTEEDIFELNFHRPKVNKKINKNIFKVTIPKGFEKQTLYLKKATAQRQ